MTNYFACNTNAFTSGPMSQRFLGCVVSPSRLLQDIESAARFAHPEVHSEVADILERSVSEPDLLDDLLITTRRGQDGRQLLHAGRDFCVVAMLWQPGQVSRVHAHRAWCAIGVRTGDLVETEFSQESASLSWKPGMRVTGCRHLGRGAARHFAAGDAGGRRLANLGVQPAISIHVHGVSFDRLDEDYDQTWVA
jgi:predicted metal-dependent enzyme (double-stranded beta helix superfamily)